jgi:hypothetical protein
VFGNADAKYANRNAQANACWRLVASRLEHVLGAFAASYQFGQRHDVYVRAQRIGAVTGVDDEKSIQLEVVKCDWIVHHEILPGNGGFSWCQLLLVRLGRAAVALPW